MNAVHAERNSYCELRQQAYAEEGAAACLESAPCTCTPPSPLLPAFHAERNRYCELRQQTYAEAALAELDARGAAAEAAALLRAHCAVIELERRLEALRARVRSAVG